MTDDAEARVPMTVWVWTSDNLEAYATLDVAAREHGLEDYEIETNDGGLRFVRLGGYNNVLVECEVIE